MHQQTNHTITVETTCPVLALRIQDDMARLLKGYERSFKDGHLRRGSALALASMNTTTRPVESTIGQPNAQAV